MVVGLTTSGVAWVFFLVRQFTERSEAKNARGVRKLKKKWAIETHFPEFKWIIYDFNNNRNNTQKTISICVSQMTVFVNLFQNLWSGYMKLLPEFQIESISAIE
jgi:hypothetical protein